MGMEERRDRTDKERQKGRYRQVKGIGGGRMKNDEIWEERERERE